MGRDVMGYRRKMTATCICNTLNMQFLVVHFVLMQHKKLPKGIVKSNPCFSISEISLEDR